MIQISGECDKWAALVKGKAPHCRVLKVRCIKEYSNRETGSDQNDADSRCFGSQLYCYFHGHRGILPIREPRAVPGPFLNPNGMAVETRDLLIEKGIPFENIVTEIYF